MPVSIQGTNSAAAPGLSGDNDSGIVAGSDQVDISTGGTSRVNVDSSGHLNIPNDSGAVRVGTSADLRLFHNGTESRIENHTGDLFFCVGTTQKITMNTNGALLIAPTTNETISQTAFGTVVKNGFLKTARDVNGSNAVLNCFGNATGDGFRVMGDGDCQNANNSYGGTSDETLKQDIVDASSQWNDIKAVKVKKFRFKSNPSAPLHIGVIAQDLEKVSPGLVTEVVQDEDNPDVKVKSVKYSVLYMKAIKALQEAQTRIETLETKVAALEAS